MSHDSPDRPALTNGDNLRLEGAAQIVARYLDAYYSEENVGEEDFDEAANSLEYARCLVRRLAPIVRG